RTRLVIIENTSNRGGGTIYDLPRIGAIAKLARAHGLALHMDGARIWNAHVKTGTPLADYAAACDSVSVCLSKGLGAPVGSVVCGSREFIGRAKRVRKMVGGGMRQAGIIAAAG
ncbi:threonine aldolase family protein, partial [Acinetobacter baumannii]|uniref:threonine aldolase family protein n=1 Tax=Acinetobacter baumannii TaxID=470 RepID=UPI0033968CDE